MDLLTIPLETSSPTPLYRQLYGYLREEILTGQLTSGDRLPSKRQLAKSAGNQPKYGYGRHTSSSWRRAISWSGRRAGITSASSTSCPIPSWRRRWRKGARPCRLPLRFHPARRGSGTLSLFVWRRLYREPSPQPSAPCCPPATAGRIFPAGSHCLLSAPFPRGDLYAGTDYYQLRYGIPVPAAHSDFSG